MEMFKAATDTRLVHVPYRGAAAAALGVLSGSVPIMFSALPVVLGGIGDGRLRALAVATRTRSPLLPEVPTLMEAGVADFEFSTWTGIFAPKGTPQPILDRMNVEIGKALNDPEVRQRLQSVGATPRPTSAAQLARLTRETYTRMASIIETAGIKAE